MATKWFHIPEEEFRDFYDVMIHYDIAHTCSRYNAQIVLPSGGYKLEYHRGFAMDRIPDEARVWLLMKYGHYVK
jgi:hypothetical protein